MGLGTIENYNKIDPQARTDSVGLLYSMEHIEENACVGRGYRFGMRARQLQLSVISRISD